MDDEQDLLDLAGEMLRTFGYEVETAADGAEAIEKYVTARNRGEPFLAVIMDLTVPNGMGGREAIASLKEVDPDVKAIVSSGYSFDPVMANYRQYGFRGIIPKPYRLEDLGRVLDEVLGEVDVTGSSRK
jgi:CheY-like chemotaxis protein